MGRVPARDGEPNLSYIVARLERAMRRAINERVQPYDLTTLQYTTMSVLGRRRALSNAQLARRSYMSPQAMSEVIDALEKRGLIERSRHPHHRRVFPAGLTAKGRKVLAACEDAVDELEAEIFGDLGRSGSSASAMASCPLSERCTRASRAEYQVT